MIIRYNEYCPLCGTVNPWRKYKSVRLAGERRVYVKCRACGKNEQIVYRDKPKKPPLQNP